MNAPMFPSVSPTVGVPAGRFVVRLCFPGRPHAVQSVRFARTPFGMRKYQPTEVLNHNTATRLGTNTVVDLVKLAVAIAAYLAPNAFLSCTNVLCMHKPLKGSVSEGEKIPN